MSKPCPMAVLLEHGSKIVHAGYQVLLGREETIAVENRLNIPMVLRCR